MDPHHFEFHKNLSKLQLLKNGNNLSLSSILIDKLNYTLRNTCAFDALFHLLFMSEKYDPFLSKLQERNSFLEMVAKKSKTGITNGSYRRRAEILKDDRTSVTHYTTEDCAIVICSSNIKDLATDLLKNIPSLTVNKQYELGCFDIDEEIVMISAPARKLEETNFQKSIEEAILNQKLNFQIVE